MIEIPEGIVLANQLNSTVKEKTIKNVIANQSPHKFAWFHGDPSGYNDLLVGKRIGDAISFGGKLEIEAEDMRIAYVEGINLRYITETNKLPKKHQLLIQLQDETYLVASVQMYGGMWVFKKDSYDNEFYTMAQKLPSPVTARFTEEYFICLIEKEGMQKLSIKAFLATKQRIPGLGNGVLQDILYNAKVHPKRKVSSLSQGERGAVFTSIKYTLNEMTEKGGRDTEKDLFGNMGGYTTKVSKNTKGQPCKKCGNDIVKASYMGGSVYFCTGCQVG
ncbi:MAG: endonuclease VIII [Clostridiales bacterium]|nr:endonuclease VIII [Clostridiales bacterium]